MMNGRLVIAYAIGDDEWERTADARWNPESEPLYDCFYGDVRVSFEGMELFGREAFQMSVADLACGFAIVLQRDLPLVGGDSTASFRQSDDALEIQFERRGDVIRISTNLSRGEALETSNDTFFSGVVQFLRAFTSEAIERVPHLLDWNDLDCLHRYAPSKL